MNKETAGRTSRSATHKQAAEEPTHEEPTPKEKWDASWERVAIGAAAAAGGGLLAATWIGVGPAALAGAAGYLAYRALKEKQQTAEAHLKH